MWKLRKLGAIAFSSLISPSVIAQIIPAHRRCASGDRTLGHSGVEIKGIRRDRLPVVICPVGVQGLHPHKVLLNLKNNIKK